MTDDELKREHNTWLIQVSQELVRAVMDNGAPFPQQLMLLVESACGLSFLAGADVDRIVVMKKKLAEAILPVIREWAERSGVMMSDEFDRVSRECMQRFQN